MSVTLEREHAVAMEHMDEAAAAWLDVRARGGDTERAHERWRFHERETRRLERRMRRRDRRQTKP